MLLAVTLPKLAFSSSTMMTWAGVELGVTQWKLEQT
jgi:hypothetical protein